MGTFLDNSAKKTLLVKKSGTGKYKVMGLWKLSSSEGFTLMVPHNYGVNNGPCGIEFDEIEYVDDLRNHRDHNLGQPDLTVIEYYRQ